MQINGMTGQSCASSCRMRIYASKSNPMHLVKGLASQVIAQIPVAIHDASSNDFHAPAQPAATHRPKAAAG